MGMSDDYHIALQREPHWFVWGVFFFTVMKRFDMYFVLARIPFAFLAGFGGWWIARAVRPMTDLIPGFHSWFDPRFIPEASSFCHFLSMQHLDLCFRPLFWVALALPKKTGARKHRVFSFPYSFGEWALLVFCHDRTGSHFFPNDFDTSPLLRLFFTDSFSCFYERSSILCGKIILGFPE